MTFVSGRYDFSDDWFSHNIPQFALFLGGLKDKPCRLLEIGTYEGRSAIWLIDNIATHDEAHVETIDASEHPSLRRNLAATGRPGKVTFHHGTSATVLRTRLLASYDFVYVDGCHWTAVVLEDAVHAFGLLKPGGIMGLDDYLWDDPRLNQEGRPKEAIDAFLAIYADKIELLHLGYQAWVRKRLPCEMAPQRTPLREISEADQLRAELGTARAELAVARIELAAMRNSKFWRLTAPFRMAVAAVRRR